MVLSSANRIPAASQGGARPSFRGLFLILILFLVAVTGCRTVPYYYQAVRGHCGILFRQKPIHRLLEDPNLDPALRRQLVKVLEIRAFAETNLNLKAGRHYLKYADLGRPYVVWDVFAAPELSLESRTWWYPVVGRLSYRGYFSETNARRLARRLEDAGDDVFVGGVDAYSTLGWFKDPVLNTFIERREEDLADLIFHELAHQRLFIKGDTDFNEAFATAVAREGVWRWMHMQEDPDKLARWQASVARQDEFIRLILATRTRLERLYESGDGLTGAKTEEELRQGKAMVIQDLRQSYERLKATWNGETSFDGWFRYPINNARLNAEATYYDLVPAFFGLLRHLDNDLERFFEEVEALGELEKEERLRVLREYEDRRPGSGVRSPTEGTHK